MHCAPPRLPSSHHLSHQTDTVSLDSLRPDIGTQPGTLDWHQPDHLGDQLGVEEYPREGEDSPGQHSPGGPVPGGGGKKKKYDGQSDMEEERRRSMMDRVTWMKKEEEV